MTRRSRWYFRRKWFEKHSVKIPFKHEPSFMNDLIMFGRAYTHTYLGDDGMAKMEYIPLNAPARNFYRKK